MITPIFTSDFSISKSILTLETDKELIPEKSVSIFSILKETKQKQLFLRETDMGGFFTAYENSEKEGIELRFGYQTIVYSECEDKEEEASKWDLRGVSRWAMSRFKVNISQGIVQSPIKFFDKPKSVSSLYVYL